MAITFVASAIFENSGAASNPIAVPSGTAVGDIMVACLGYRGNVVGITPPSGWTLISRTNEVTHMSLSMYYRAFVAGDTSFTWTFALNVNAASVIVSYSGCDTTSPVDVSATQTNNASLTITGPSVTTTFANDMGLSIALSESSGQNFAVPTGQTLRAYASAHGASVNNSGCSIGVWDKLLPSIGATGTWTTTQDNSRDSIGGTVALKTSTVGRANLLASLGVG